VDQTTRVVAATLAVGLAVLAAALVVTLSHASTRRTGTNRMTVDTVLLVTKGGGTLCQPDEVVPAGTGALGLSIKPAVAHASPSVAVDLMRGRTTVAHGTRGPGWSGEQVIVPLRSRLRQDLSGSICITLGPQQVALGGAKTKRAFTATSGTTHLSGRLRVDYLPHAGRTSWWSTATTVARRIGLGHAPAGAWGALLILACMLTAIVLSSWQLVRRDA
jgi:hypothetical protein